jgi:IclR family transcriptional regulator, KDG regulon repressor
MVDTTVPLLRDTDILPPQSATAADYAVLLSGDRLLAVVELLMRNSEALSARAIADATGIHRSTTHRALNTLIHRGWVERQPDSADYRLSVKFLALAHVATQERSFLREVRPALERLSALSRETVHVGVLDGLDVLHLDKIDSLERVGVASKIGSRGPAHSASLGRALLAASPDRAVEAFIVESDLSRGAYRLPDPQRFREEIARTRQRGYALDDEEDSIGVRCLGVAVRGAGGAPLFAISMTGPSARFTLERALSFAPAAVEIARDLSLRLGWQPGES